ncbi:hypothetical protein SK854_45865 [Lentzea sp. BCCO 10_0061]|uniref:Uncharacterized protein n=1 Tax=Lentzea sokolovensis TaxID=3095429 RepID=A0ABU4VCJ6_9PSEU|nr:hypothetical protein [Lentzea sp. BCCO 10_0061]MDX8149518.1 hypothetical protein [Lentzea sp. BCCO 10_0061]
MTKNQDPSKIVSPFTGWDMDGYSSHVVDDQRQAQAALVEMDQRAAQAAGLPRLSKSSVQRAGDGAMMRWPADTDLARLLTDYPAKLVTELNAVNKRLAAEHRIRVRIAIGYGMSEEAAGGFAGPAPIAVARMLEAESVKQALKDNPDAAVVLVIDSYLHKEFVLQHVSGLNPNDFTPAQISVKNFHETAWIAVLGRDERTPTVMPANPEKTREAGDPRTSGPIIAAVIGAVAAITAAIITASAYLNKADGTNTSTPPTTPTPTSAPTATTTTASLSTVSPPALATFKEVGGNRLGVQTFISTRGHVADNKPLIYFGDEVQVRCWAANKSGMPSINRFYLITGGIWDGLYAPANTFLNGAPPEDPGSTQIDPAVPPCA